METGLLNFHDEEHFTVFDQSSQFVNDNSIFDSFVDFGDEGSSWVIPEPGLEFGLNPVVTETKEDYQKTIQDWQQHISNLQVPENDCKDDTNLLSSDPFGDIPDIFSSDVSIPTENLPTEVPKNEEVHTYKVAKRKGLVIKLTKKKDDKDCDNPIVHKPKKEEKHKRKDSSLPVNNKPEKKKMPDLLPLNTIKDMNTLPVQTIKTEPLEDYDLPSNELEEAVASIDFGHSDNYDYPTFDFDGQQTHEYSETVLPVMSEIEQAVATIEPKKEYDITAEKKPNITVEKKPEKVKKDKSSKSKKRRSVDVAENTFMPKIKIEEEDYFSVKSEIVDTPAENTLTNIKIEKASPIKVEESQLDDDDNWIYFGSSTSTDEHVDVEHIDSGPTPILEAPDVNTLLNQFESSNSVNKPLSAAKSVSKVHMDSLRVNRSVSSLSSAPQQTPSVSTLKPTTKSILEALPKEVIDRIKESSKRIKKSVPVVPAERLPKKGNACMKDAGATPPKEKRIIETKNRRSGEMVKLDHDYCTNQNQSQKQEKPAAKRPIKEENAQANGEWEKKWDSKKDSGLESGDVSDSSETLERARGKPSPSGQFSNSESVLMIKEEKHVSPEPGEIIEEEPKKKKLNLEEYRNRRKNVTPKTPVKKPWNIPVTKPATNGNEAEASSQKVNAEVQVKIEDTKTESTAERDVSRRSPHTRIRRRSSSSSSSCAGKSRYRRRGRSKRRRHSRRSRWSRSRSRSISRSHSRSRSKSRSRSRSRSHSKSSSRSYSSDSSRSRSRSRGRSRRRHRSRSYRRSSSRRYSSRNRSRSRKFSLKRSDDWSPAEKTRQVEERRVIYVGRLEEGTTRAQLRERFAMFGPIVDISLHFREKGDNYGFVTFAYKADAYEAVEHGNDYPYQPKYDICFGGRRAFCKQRYSDLDGTSPQSYSPHQLNSRSFDTFDRLLREAQKKLKKTNNV